MPSLSRILRALPAVALLAIGACAKPESKTADSAVVQSPAATTDTGMAGMDHSNMAGMNRGLAKDGDQEFLRMMVDHHEGLIVMMDEGMEKAASAGARADAKKLHDKQHAERDRMVAMLKSAYSDSIMPMAMPSATAMSDTLGQKSGAEYDRTMYRFIVAHHREALAMIDRMKPGMARADVKAMADRMRADQAKEIAAFERKAGSAS